VSCPNVSRVSTLRGSQRASRRPAQMRTDQLFHYAAVGVILHRFSPSCGQPRTTQSSGQSRPWSSCVLMASTEPRLADWGTMRSKRIAIGIGFVALALTACSRSYSSSPTTTSTTSPLGPAASTTAPPDIQSLVLSISDLPTGWTEDNSPNNSSSLSCEPPAMHNYITRADVTFDQGGGLPVLIESLRYYNSATTSSATTSFAIGVAALNACKTFTTTGSGTNYSGTLGAMSSPTYGDQSAAYNLNLTVQGLNFNEGFVVVRKGNYIALVILGDIGSLDSATLQGFVTRAVAKIPAATT
jgi:hypothetical protein